MINKQRLNTQGKSLGIEGGRIAGGFCIIWHIVGKISWLVSINGGFFHIDLTHVGGIN